MNSRRVFLILVLGYLFFSFIGFYISDSTTNLLVGFNKTIASLAFNYPADNNFWLDLAKLFAILVVFYGAILLFAQKWLNEWRVRRLQHRPY